jgi:hypothetical protein
MFRWLVHFHPFQIKFQVPDTMKPNTFLYYRTDTEQESFKS